MKSPQKGIIKSMPFVCLVINNSYFVGLITFQKLRCVPIVSNSKKLKKYYSTYSEKTYRHYYDKTSEFQETIMGSNCTFLNNVK